MDDKERFVLKVPSPVTAKPKYTIGDLVWLIEHKKAKYGYIIGIGLCGANEIRYFVSNMPLNRNETIRAYEPEDELFSTKEELLASL